MVTLTGTKIILYLVMHDLIVLIALDEEKLWNSSLRNFPHYSITQSLLRINYSTQHIHRRCYLSSRF